LGEIPERSGISGSSVQQAVNGCATALVALDKFAAQGIDATEEGPAFRRALTFECGKGGLECTQFPVVKIGEISEVQSITDVAEFDDSRVVGTHGGVSRRPRRPGALLLAEHGGEFTRCGTRMRPRTTAGPLHTHDVEPALCDTAHERHHVFFPLQRRAQRAQFTQ